MGILLIIEGIFIATAVPVSLIYQEATWKSILLSAFITSFSGTVVWWFFRDKKKKLGKREGYLIVTFGWLLFSAFGALPFVISGSIGSYTDAFFETISGFTTTGASILSAQEIDQLPLGLHFWRSLIQWLGGMGIIVLSLVVLPTLGIGGMQLFVAEVPGPTPDKLHPRVKETAKILWGVYAAITLIQVLLLWAGEMNLFDAVTHSFTTMSTGGFSTKGENIAFFQTGYTHYIISIFMIIAGMNFTLAYFGFQLKFRPIWKNEELRWYLGIILTFTIIITSLLILSNNSYSTESAFRHSLFQAASIITTTGFVTQDYLKWVPIAWVLLMVLMFIGGSAGSTASSIKVVRIVLLIKNGLLELKRIIHPNAIIPVRLDNQAMHPKIISSVLSFVTVYILTVIIGIVVISFLGYDLETSIGAVTATLGNIGPGLGEVGPAGNFGHFSIFGKWFFSFLMLIGRLELFTVLIILSPAFWKK